MRITIIAAALVMGFSPAAAQTQASGCYRFNGFLFWRLAWTQDRARWALDSSSIIHLTDDSHPPGRMARAGDRLVRAPWPAADSVRVKPETFWRSPGENRLTIYFFTGLSNYVIEASIRGDSLRGKLTNHADRVDPRPQVLPVAASRIPCADAASSDKP